MKFEVPEEVMRHARRGIRLTPQAFLTAIRRTWPTLWSVCERLAYEREQTEERVFRNIADYEGIRHLQILHGMAGTAVRRGLCQHFRCRFHMSDEHTIVASELGGSESPPSTRIGIIIERDLWLGAARLARLAARATDEPGGFATDSAEPISDLELLQVLRIHAVEPYRKAQETIHGVQFAFHSPRVSAARRRGVPSVFFEAFVGQEEVILHSSLPQQRD